MSRHRRQQKRRMRRNKGYLRKVFHLWTLGLTPKEWAKMEAAAEGRVYVFHVAPNPRILTSHHNHSEPGDEWCSMGCPKFKLKSSRSAL